MVITEIQTDKVRRSVSWKIIPKVKKEDFLKYGSVDLWIEDYIEKHRKLGKMYCYSWIEFKVEQ